MMPVAITFTDDKMLGLAEEQHENFRYYGIEHEIIRIPDVQSYSTDLWIKFIDLTIDSVKRHGKIFRVDSEIRLHRRLPDHWLENDNVFFRTHPIVKDPWYLAINTGHMIMSKSGIAFFELLKECMLAMIPPDGDTSLPCMGEGVYIDDEWPSAIALKLSKVKFYQELLKVDRRDPTQCAANRGVWVEECTILTHPGIHTWTQSGGGSRDVHKEMNVSNFINHYPGDLKEAEFIADLMVARKDSNIWNKLGQKIENGLYEIEGFVFQPMTGQFAPKEHWPKHPKTMVGN